MKKSLCIPVLLTGLSATSANAHENYITGTPVGPHQHITLEVRRGIVRIIEGLAETTNFPTPSAIEEMKDRGIICTYSNTTPVVKRCYGVPAAGTILAPYPSSQ